MVTPPEEPLEDLFAPEHESVLTFIKRLLIVSIPLMAVIVIFHLLGQVMHDGFAGLIHATLYFVAFLYTASVPFAMLRLKWREWGSKKS